MNILRTPLLLAHLTVWFGVIAVCPAWAEIVYDGSVPFGQQAVAPAAKVFEGKTGIKIEIRLNGTEKGVQAVVEKRADLAGVARSLTNEEKKQKLFYQIVAYDSVALFLNSKNPVNNLTREQLKKIYLGQIANWREVGGPNAPISLWMDVNPGRGAVPKTFQKLVMDGRPFTPALHTLATQNGSLQHLQTVAGDANAMTFDSLALKIPGIKVISIDEVAPSAENVRSGAYLLARPIHLVTQGIPRGEVKKFLDFMLSSEGQEIIKKLFVPVI